MSTQITSDRITIMLDSDLNKKIRHLQAKRIIETRSTQSFSKILNQVLRGELKI